MHSCCHSPTVNMQWLLMCHLLLSGVHMFYHLYRNINRKAEHWSPCLRDPRPHWRWFVCLEVDFWPGKFWKILHLFIVTLCTSAIWLSNISHHHSIFTVSSLCDILKKIIHMSYDVALCVFSTVFVYVFAPIKEAFYPAKKTFLSNKHFLIGELNVAHCERIQLRKCKSTCGCLSWLVSCHQSVTRLKKKNAHCSPPDSGNGMVKDRVRLLKNVLVSLFCYTSRQQQNMNTN